jgi:hypothetical protein
MNQAEIPVCDGNRYISKSASDQFRSKRGKQEGYEDNSLFVGVTNNPSALHMTYLTGGLFRDALLLLDIVQHDGGRRAEDDTSRPAIEDLVRLRGGLDGLQDRVG